MLGSGYDIDESYIGLLATSSSIFLSIWAIYLGSETTSMSTISPVMFPGPRWLEMVVDGDAVWGDELEECIRD